MDKTEFYDYHVTIAGDEAPITAQQALDNITSFKLVQWQEVATMSLPVPNIKYFQSWLKIMTWDFNFMSGGLAWVRLFIFTPISAAAAFGMFILFINALHGVLSTIRGG